MPPRLPSSAPCPSPRPADVSFASDELSGRKRKRRGEDEEGEEESDPEVHLEDFEKREIMRVRGLGCWGSKSNHSFGFNH